MMAERTMADGIACRTCAARTLTNESDICEPWKLGSSNKKKGQGKSFVLGRNHYSGTTMRPINCPHPDSKTPTTQNAYVVLRKKLGR